MASTQTKVYDVVRKSIDCFYEMRNMYDLKKKTESHTVYIQMTKTNKTMKRPLMEIESCSWFPSGI